MEAAERGEGSTLGSFARAHLSAAVSHAAQHVRDEVVITKSPVDAVRQRPKPQDIAERVDESVRVGRGRLHGGRSSVA